LLFTKPLFYLLVISAMAAGAWFRVPAAGTAYGMTKSMPCAGSALGSWEVQKDGKKEFEPIEWTDTLFENHNGNNHLLHSALSRLSLDAWRGLGKDKEPWEFDAKPCAYLRSSPVC